MKSIALLLLQLVCFLIFPQKTLAQEKDFYVTVETSYIVEESGSTTVSHLFSIENLTPFNYLTNYTVSLGDADPQNVDLSTQDGEITKEESVSNSEIVLNFQKPMVGQGKKRVFTLSYQSLSIAKIHGTTLDLSIPSLNNHDSVTTIKTSIDVPKKFGLPSYVSAAYTVNEGESNQLLFESTPNEPILAYFGKSQDMDLEVIYTLKNDSPNPVLSQIILPPDTLWQKIIYTNLEPRPESINQDIDGNWLATYSIQGNASLDVVLNTFVSLSLEPFNDVQVTPPNKNHLSEQKFWEIHQSELQEFVGDAQTIEEIYDLLIKTLTYRTPNEKNRLTSTQALSNLENSSAQQYSDLFVTIARSKKIPARIVTGYALSNNQLTHPSRSLDQPLHTWAEYYEEKTNQWRPVDVTWGDTTNRNYLSLFDIQHITFLKNGNSSIIPSFNQEENANQKLTLKITAQPNQSPPMVEPHFEVLTTPRKIFGVPLPGFFTITIRNHTGQAWYNLDVRFESQSSIFETQKPIAQTVLLPYQDKTFDIIVSNTQNRLQEQLAIVNLQSKNGTHYFKQSATFTSIPRYAKWFYHPWFPLAMALSCLSITVITWRLLVFRRKKQRTLRRKS